MSFTETWLNESWCNEMLSTPNYSITRKDRTNSTRGGGLICYVLNSVPAVERSDLIEEDLEAICTR